MSYNIPRHFDIVLIIYKKRIEGRIEQQRHASQLRAHEVKTRSGMEAKKQENEICDLRR